MRDDFLKKSRRERYAVRDDVVRAVGFEPTRLAAQEPKSCTSANSAIPAYSVSLYFYSGRGPEAERNA